MFEHNDLVIIKQECRVDYKHRPFHNRVGCVDHHHPIIVTPPGKVAVVFAYPHHFQEVHVEESALEVADPSRLCECKRLYTLPASPQCLECKCIKGGIYEDPREPKESADPRYSLVYHLAGQGWQLCLMANRNTGDHYFEVEGGPVKLNLERMGSLMDAITHSVCTARAKRNTKGGVEDGVSPVQQ